MLLVLTVLSLAACSTGGSAQSQAGDRIELGGQQIVSHGETDIGGQTAEDVEVADFFFSPTVLRGSGGQTITLSIHNSTSTLHNFTLVQEQIDQEVPPGQTVKVTATLPVSGGLVFFCKYHRGRGMLGALEAG
jgi:plastocyanin